MSADVRQYRLGDVGEGAVVQVGEHLSAQYLVFPNVADLDIGALKAALMEGARVEPAGPGPAVRELPTPIEPGLRPVSGLLDRRHELEAAAAAIEAGELVQFHAAGDGWGKTTLLRHLAYDHDTGSFADGVVYVAVRRRPIEDLLQELFESFYETDGAYKPSAAALTRYLGGKRALILLDDVDFEPRDLEWLLDAARECGYVLTAATSQAWGQGTTIPVQGLPSEDGVTLLSRRLGRELAGRERRLAGALSAALRGHPGRLRQAADVMRGGRPLTELVDALQGAASPERALAALLVEPLAPTEQAVVGLCAAWGATPLADEHVQALVARPDVAAGVERLLKTDILETCSPRYRLAGALTEDLADLWDLTPWLERGLDYFADWAERHVTKPPRLLADADAILRIAEWGVEAARWPQVLAVAKAMDPALALGLRWGAWGNVLRWGLAAAVNLGDGRAEAWALHQLGSRALCLDDVAVAGDQLSRALGLREAQGDQRGAATTRHNLDVLALRPPPGPPEPAGPSGLPPWGFLLLALAVLALLGGVLWGTIQWLRGPELQVDPSRVDFGAIALGTRAFQSLSVTNAASGPLTVDRIVPGGDPAFDVAATTCARPLEPGAACTVTVGFAPLAEAALSAELAIHHSGSGDPLPVALNGSGVVSDLTIEPPSVDFGAVPVATRVTQDLDVTNTGSAPLTVDRVRGDPAFTVAESTCVGPLEPGAACTLSMGFLPTVEGRHVGGVAIHHSGRGKRVDVPLSGTGVPAGLEVKPTSVEFGAIAVGTTATQALNISNSGAAPLTVADVTLDGSPQFALAASACAGPLQPGAACKLTVGFAPTADGRDSASLAIRHTGPGGRFDVPVTGTGVSSDLMVEPPSVDFGAVAVTATASRDLSVANTGSAPLTVHRVALGGDPAFEVAATTCAGPLVPGAACRVTIRYAPTADGRQSARASIHHSGAGGRLDVPVSGAGVGPDPTLWAFRVAVAGPTGRACDDCGVITSDPPGISCPTDCAEDYPHGSRVTLTATAGAGWQFTAWEGACSGTEPTCTLEITDSVLARAVFTPATAPQAVELAVEVIDDTGSPECDGCGTVSSDPPGISCPDDCAEDYPSGSGVTLTATPHQGWQFSRWEDACAGFGEGPSCILDMTDSRLARAVFAPVTSPQAVELVVEVAAGSCSECFVTSDPPGISCPPDCTERYPYGSTVTLTATSGEWEFSHWEGDCASFGQRPTCTLDMTDSWWATALFDPIFSLSVAVADDTGEACQGCGTVSSEPPGISCPTDCFEDYVEGSTVALTATALGGWQFAGWAGDCSGTAATCTVDMNDSRSVTAVFAPAPGPG